MRQRNKGPQRHRKKKEQAAFIDIFGTHRLFYCAKNSVAQENLPTNQDCQGLKKSPHGAHCSWAGLVLG